MLGFNPENSLEDNQKAMEDNLPTVKSGQVTTAIRDTKINNLEIQYVHRQETKEFINNYFEKKNIEIEDVTFEVQIIENERISRNTFTIDLTYADVIDDLSMYPNIREVRLVAVND